MITQNKGIQRKLLLVVLLPITILMTLFIVVGLLLLNKANSGSIQNELTSTTSVLVDSLDLTVRGDYSYENNMLLKGNLNITDSTMLYRIKEDSKIDTSIFWLDTRILTTLEDKYGVSFVGTKANEEVVKAVLNKGENFYSDNLDINGMTYIAYYTPLENSDHTIVGMVFAGKNKDIVYENMRTMLLWFLGVAIVAIIVAVILITYFSKKMALDINRINGFLRSLSEGNLVVNMDENITKRTDELGTIGQYAVKMRDDLQKMIERDPLTSLFNRRSGNNRLSIMENESEMFTIVMCDIDWFKKVNDNYGHDAGDYVLVTISQLIQDNMQDDGYACRWGGEEFLLIYRLEVSETIRRIEELQKAIRSYNFRYGKQNIVITMTFGIESGDRNKFYEERIKEADNRLYDGKNNGRDQIVCG